MNDTEKKETWRLLGVAVDDATAAEGHADAFLVRLALLCAVELSCVDRVRALIATAHEAGRQARPPEPTPHQERADRSRTSPASGIA